jgi:hypothetical protein
LALIENNVGMLIAKSEFAAEFPLIFGIRFTKNNANRENYSLPLIATRD